MVGTYGLPDSVGRGVWDEWGGQRELNLLFFFSEDCCPIVNKFAKIRMAPSRKAQTERVISLISIIEGEFSLIVAPRTVSLTYLSVYPNPKSKNHLITLSARYRTDCGIVNPIRFAVLRLITSSNFFGCSTGRSAGFVPFRILST